jgi:hypothetical protein
MFKQARMNQVRRRIVMHISSNGSVNIGQSARKCMYVCAIQRTHFWLFLLIYLLLFHNGLTWRRPGALSVWA